ncbi:radical SAM family uncharacterized protein [Desulfitispora alkaliphila]|uniref:TIGR03960 family B12-binding radical SAM protein n=1 Tax=Desulfitispora alkaliphila TaxID=622674 RepID=UPI003D21D693
MNSKDLRSIIEDRILSQVEKPARYLGNEWNVVKKDWDHINVKMAFAFPDVYEVGMSHLGLKILYGLVNDRESFLMERVFTPWVDMEELMRKEGIPLFALESYRPLGDFDLLGFTLQYEMSYTNILNMLDLSGVPMYAEDRSDQDPIVIAGGPCAYNPEPLAPFIDVVVLGEAEELLIELLEITEQHKEANGGKVIRDKLLEEMVEVKGIYIPRYYQVLYEESGAVKEIVPQHPKAPAEINKRIVKDFDQSYFPNKPIVPYMEVVHDRVVLEVLRGCARGCRFCQAGMVYRPVREKTEETLFKQAEAIEKQTGYNEISLTSLSTSDYTCVEPLLINLSKHFKEKRVGVSLPSLRVDTFSVNLAEQVQQVRKSGLTFAPEAGTQRLRDVINKGVEEENLEQAVTAAFKAGWSRIKLYFMLGLPTETYEDLNGIADLARRVLEIGKREAKAAGTKKRVQVTVSVSSFVPKPHTPFQWVGQNELQLLKDKQNYLKDKLRHPQITYNWHEADLSFAEALFSKGSRRLAGVLYRAWEKGCRFDGWAEHFDIEKWLEAIADEGIDPEFYANREIPETEILPWDHLKAGLKKEFLWQEYQQALAEAPTGDCRFVKCTDCGVCPETKVGNVLQKRGGTGV